jgi:dienelactone hydrolase
MAVRKCLLLQGRHFLELYFATALGFTGFVMFASHARVVLAVALALFSLHAGSTEQTSITITPAGSSVQLPATLIKPDGDGPFPAVVIVHDCSGLGPRSSGAPMRWAVELLQHGYVILIPDSFSPRGFADGVCFIPGKQSVSVNGFVRAADAYGALATLRALPYVDGKRVGIMGGSHGGSTTLAAMYMPIDANDPLTEAKRDGFAAAVALYPGCGPRFGAWSTSKPGNFGPVTGHSGVYQPIAPLLILTGEKDDWTPAEPCRWLADASRAAGHPVEIKIYPGAHHSFDNDRPIRYDWQRNNASSSSGRGATTGGDPSAWADAKKQVAAFFSLHLKRP